MSKSFHTSHLWFPTCQPHSGKLHLFNVEIIFILSDTSSFFEWVRTSGMMICDILKTKLPYKYGMWVRRVPYCSKFPFCSLVFSTQTLLFVCMCNVDINYPECYNWYGREANFQQELESMELGPSVFCAIVGYEILIGCFIVEYHFSDSNVACSTWRIRRTCWRAEEINLILRVTLCPRRSRTPN